MSHIRRIAHQNKTMRLKTASYYVIHICVAALVAYAVTGNLVAWVCACYVLLFLFGR